MKEKYKAIGELLINKVLILDASAIMGGFKPHLINQEQYIPTGVMEEIISAKAEENLNLGFKEKKLSVRDPSQKSIDEINQFALKTGDSFVLSDVDISVLALALELKNEGKDPIILTDDYSIQNLAGKLELEFDSIIESGIRKQIQWKIVCPSCRKAYPHSKKKAICDSCGTPLKRVKKRKK